MVVVIPDFSEPDVFGLLSFVNLWGFIPCDHSERKLFVLARDTFMELLLKASFVVD